MINLKCHQVNKYSTRGAIFKSAVRTGTRTPPHMSVYNIKFDPPTKIETARMNNKARCLFVRLTFPGLERPFPISQHSTWFNALLSCCFSSDSFNDDFEPTWSSLLKPQTPTISPFSGEWNSVQPSQKPRNGDIWLRVSNNRISIMLILCGPSPISQRPDSRSSDGLQESLKSLSISDLQEQDGEAYSELFPTIYYYWDSGRLSRSIDPLRSSLAVTDRSVCLMLTSLKKGMGWCDGDIRIIQKSVPQKEPIEKRDFCWQESVKDTEETNSDKYIEVNYDNVGSFPSKSPEIGDVMSEEFPTDVMNKPERQFPIQLPSYSNKMYPTNINTWLDVPIDRIPAESTEHLTPPQPSRSQVKKTRAVSETKQKANLRQEVRRRRHEMLMQIFASSQPSTRTSISSEGHGLPS